MNERRASITIGVTYNTSASKLKEIPIIIKNIIESVDGVRLDRAHFKTFNSSSLDFEIVYFTKGGDYVKHLDASQKINIMIIEAFEKEKIEFAFPTQTIYIEK